MDPHQGCKHKGVKVGRIYAALNFPWVLDQVQSARVAPEGILVISLHSFGIILGPAETKTKGPVEAAMEFSWRIRNATKLIYTIKVETIEYNCHQN